MEEMRDSLGDGGKPTIGIRHCTSKHAGVAENALCDHAAPISAAACATSITASLPADLAAHRPSIKTLEVELSRTPKKDAV